MQQRQLRLGDVLDDYCPRERRVTNHAVVAMVGDDVRLTRCTTCDAEHEYKHARIPRQRRKADTPAALFTQVAASGPKVVGHEPVAEALDDAVAEIADAEPQSSNGTMGVAAADLEEVEGDVNELDDADDETHEPSEIEGPAHRRLIRATLPKLDGLVPPARPGPDFTIRQPAGGRANRFRPRHQRGGQVSFGNGNGNGNGPMRVGSRQSAGRSAQMPGPQGRRGSGRKRSK